jgi:asparagine synthase (glutamine-hydrolysing)
MNYAAGGLGAVACAHDGLPGYRRAGVLGERLADAEVSRRRIAWSRESARELLTEFLRHDRRTRFVGEYLTKVDGATMHHALEARSPFLDQALWEFAAALPYSVRLNGGTLKAVLRELARRRVSAQVAGGRKRGFGIPVGRWVAGRWRGAVADSLRDSLVERHGWIRAGAALAQLEEAARQGSAPNRLWYVYVLESWLRHEQSEAQSQASSPAAPGGGRETLAALSA